MRFIRYLAAASPLALSGCSYQDLRLLNPAGPLARTEFHYMLAIFAVMLIIIVPTLVMTVIFPIRYHHSRNAKYTPHWHFSLPIEILAWGIPLGIVVVLCYFTVNGVYALDPWNPGALKSYAGNAEPAINVEVIATDWQWVFIYPDREDRHHRRSRRARGPARQSRLTSTSNMDGFYIPQLAPMVDAMPAMRSEGRLRHRPARQFHRLLDRLLRRRLLLDAILHPRRVGCRLRRLGEGVQASGNALDYAAFDTKIAPAQVNYGAKPSYFTLGDPGLFGEVIMAARWARPIRCRTSCERRRLEHHRQQLIRAQERIDSPCRSH